MEFILIDGYRCQCHRCTDFTLSCLSMYYEWVESMVKISIQRRTVSTGRLQTGRFRAYYSLKGDGFFQDPVLYTFNSFIVDDTIYIFESFHALWTLTRLDLWRDEFFREMCPSTLSSPVLFFIHDGAVLGQLRTIVQLCLTSLSAFESVLL